MPCATMVTPWAGLSVVPVLVVAANTGLDQWTVAQAAVCAWKQVARVQRTCVLSPAPWQPGDTGQLPRCQLTVILDTLTGSRDFPQSSADIVTCRFSVVTEERPQQDAVCLYKSVQKPFSAI